MTSPAVSKLALTQVFSPGLTQFDGIQLHPFQQNFVPSAKTIIKNYIFDRKDNKPPYDVFQVQDGNRIAGLITLEKASNHYLWLGGFQLDKEYQSKGLGKRVMLGIYRMVLNDHSLRGLMLDVCVNNISGIEFYQLLGLSIYDTYCKDDRMLWVMKIDSPRIDHCLKYDRVSALNKGNLA